MKRRMRRKCPGESKVVPHFTWNNCVSDLPEPALQARWSGRQASGCGRVGGVHRLQRELVELLDDAVKEREGRALQRIGGLFCWEFLEHPKKHLVAPQVLSRPGHQRALQGQEGFYNCAQRGTVRRAIGLGG